MDSFTPPPGEKSWANFHTIVALVIAVASTLGAIVAYRASLAEIDGVELDRQLIQERMQVETELQQKKGMVYGDVALSARFQQHLLAWHLLEQEAAAAYRQHRQDAAVDFALQAQAELALARAMTPYFRADDPALSDGHEWDAVYNTDAVTNRQLAADDALTRLHPELTEARAESAHRKTRNLVGVEALFITSLFFLTLAEFAAPRIRVPSALAGAGVIAVALAAWLVVERFLS
jgi:hypothetical protein